MKEISQLRRLATGALLLSAALIAGCGSGIDGTYRDSAGVMSIKFDSGTAYLTTPAGMVRTRYEVNGDTVTLKSSMGDIVFQRMPDGSLGGPAGILKKTGP